MKAPLQHDPDDSFAIGAERHAQPDFVRSLRHFIGGHSVQTDGGERQRRDPEQSREARDGTLLVEGAIHLLLQRPHAGDGETA